ncbi:hypothetical protein LUZ63_007260 [Rhynchospora breviuscula]|uniref:PGG domain-containing protein n=1 Tax=Rhynchospora breviuscula TaxID=2022672 RepID=A0A9Q0CRP2_9POAL|nr:hypothetical protein LUZ63_007260 [Rhynchospora breviuscula]
MAQISQNVPNSVHPSENYETNGSPSKYDMKLPTPPGSPNNMPDTNSSSETGTHILTPIPSNTDDQDFFKEMRGWLMIVAILAAGSTYQAGLNPPGGVWQTDDEKNDTVAGMSILHDKLFNRYQAFFYCNAISFLSSLVIIIFLMTKNFYLDKKKVSVLKITMVLDLFSFMAAYAVGSCRRVTTSIYIFLLMGGVFVYVISFVRHYSVLRSFASQMKSIRRRMQNTEQQQELDVV